MARLAFLGSPDAAVPSLQALEAAGHDVTLVVSQPDRRRGRGAALTASPVKRAALEMSMAVSDSLDDVLSCGAELGVVVAYGRIIPQRVLDRIEMINAHFSLLPRWRGAAPVERAILAGDKVTGVSIMRLEKGLDTGPVLLMKRVDVDEREREHASHLTQRLSLVAAGLLVEVLSQGVAMIGPGKAQSGEATYASKIEPDELHLDFARPVVDLERVVRLDRAWTTFRDERLLVLDALARPGAQRSSLGVLLGTSVSASDGTLELLEVQPAGRRPLPAAAWVRGARPSSGEKLG